ncbi:hypothetical protein BG28_01370 [Nesterenkonia sp. AN1]|uniref:ERF1-like protein n=1 Tax=Nesterenkonia aurantiaca TaxID=1436010 RepID=A0A4R7FY05_9MICC|nr:hypothetical protein [Nesterenkonia]EXF26225.1 hypothetical protein BG28_01370 [Nesterenkonia sp. AN1]TDS83739.1 hypothetical protein EV640_10924 [Nesterenkonia aurantiaca]
MQLTNLRGVYEAQGPFATVYLEARSPAADAEDQLRLRWQDLRAQLADAGTPDVALTELDEAVTGPAPTEVHTEGRVLVADQTRVVLNEHFDAAQGSGDLATVGEPPQLGDYVRHRLGAARMLVVIADQQQALIRRLVVSGEELLASAQEESVQGSSVESVHKPRQGALSHKQIQRSADEAATQNIRDITQRVAKIADSWNPDVIVVAGETQGRRALHEELPKALQELAVEAETGGGIPAGNADEGTEQALRDELTVIARRVVIQRGNEQTDRYGEATGHGRSAEGVEEIRAAIRLGAVDTLLLRQDERAEGEDQLLADASASGASFGLVGAPVSDAVAAVLRYEAPVQDVAD